MHKSKRYGSKSTRTEKGNESSPFQDWYTPYEEAKASSDDLKIHSTPRTATER